MEYYICFVDENELTWHLEELPSPSTLCVSAPPPQLFTWHYFFTPIFCETNETCHADSGGSP